MADIGCEIVAIDSSAPQVEAARKLGLDAHVMSGEELPFEAKGVTVLPVRAAVDAEQAGIFLSTLITERFRDQSMDLGTVVAFETDIFDARQLQL